MFQKRVPVWAEQWALSSTCCAHGANLDPRSLPAQSSQTLCQYSTGQLSQLQPLLSLTQLISLQHEIEFSPVMNF